jgi:hypothetical protein
MDDLNLIIKDVKGLVCTVCCPIDWHIADVKAEILRVASLPDSEVRLVWLGALLEDHRTLRSYSFSDGTIFYLSLAKKKPQNGPTPIGTDPRSFAGAIESPMMSMAGKMFETNRDTFTQMMHEMATISKIDEEDPEIHHAVDDTDFIQEQFAMTGSGTVARKLDRMFDGAERIPKGTAILNRQFNMFFNAIKLRPVPIPTTLPADPLEPSDAPLPDTPFTRAGAASSVVQELRDELLRLQVLGVDLTRLPGMELLARACPKIDCAEVQRTFYRQFMQCRAYGFDDVEMVAKALIASRGDLNVAIPLLSKRRTTDARIAQSEQT